MLLILSALLFSLSSNLDNLVIGIAYGVKKIKLGPIPNIIIALISSTGTFLSMSVGIYIAKFFPKSVANGIGAAMVICLGVYFLIQSIINILKDSKSKELALKNIDDMIKYAEDSDVDSSKNINIKEALFIAFGLTFNNLGTGIAASITGVNIKFTILLTFVLSIITLSLGQAIGKCILGKFLGKYAPLFSGILLIILGIIELFN